MFASTSISNMRSNTNAFFMFSKMPLQHLRRSVFKRPQHCKRPLAAPMDGSADDCARAHKLRRVVLSQFVSAVQAPCADFDQAVQHHHRHEFVHAFCQPCAQTEMRSPFTCCSLTESQNRINQANQRDQCSERASSRKSRKSG